MVLVAVRVNNNFLADKPGTYANVCPQTTIMQTWLGALTHQLWVKTANTSLSVIVRQRWQVLIRQHYKMPVHKNISKLYSTSTILKTKALILGL